MEVSKLHTPNPIKYCWNAFSKDAAEQEPERGGWKGVAGSL